jgi:hypothetical protein
MPCTLCAVVPSGKGWLTQIGKAEKGPYLSRDMATRVALTEALKIRREGGRARLSVQNDGGDVQVERCLCAEFPVPPSAVIERASAAQAG